MRHWFTMLALGLLAGTLALGGGEAGATQSAAVDSDAVWAAVRAKAPQDQRLYRPTWLPDRFRQPGVAESGPIPIGVTYKSDEGDFLTFSLGGGNSCAPSGPISEEPVLVHGIRGHLATSDSDCFPQIIVSWIESGQTQLIWGKQSATGRAAVSRDEMLHIVAGLAPVGQDGKPLAGPPNAGLPGAACFNETGQCVGGPFLDYWRAHGGLATNGYPLTGEMLERLADGKLYQVQYFERVRMEWHPENQPPYDVLLGQFGRRILQARTGHGAESPVQPKSGYAYFRVTGHNVAPDFDAYWQANGGLAQFGYPLTEEFQEQLEDGKTYTVQYFERARFERHPENPAPWNIELGQFGRQILAGSGAR